MTSSVLIATQNDPLALEIAGALALANPAALAQGQDPKDKRISLVKEMCDGKLLWCVHYGPRDYIRVRGGSLSVYVDVDAGAVVKVLREQ